MARGISCWAADAEFRLLCDGGRKRHGNASGIWLAHRRAALSQEKIRIGRHKERAREGIQCLRGTAHVWARLTNAPNSLRLLPATNVTTGPIPEISVFGSWGHAGSHPTVATKYTCTSP